MLQGPDDRYAILTAGDEMVLTFDAHEPPAPGLARTWVLESSGWVKDGDYSTAFSETRSRPASPRERM